MTRLIDADALIEDIKSFWDWDSINGITSETVLKQTISDIDNAPTIDAVPVVRCKDCRWWDKTDNGFGYCHAEKHCHISAHWEISIFRTYRGDHFCADGEREDDE